MKFRVGKNCFAARDIAQAEAHCENVEFEVNSLEVEEPKGSRIYTPVKSLCASQTTVDKEEISD